MKNKFCKVIIFPTFEMQKKVKMNKNIVRIQSLVSVYDNGFSDFLPSATSDCIFFAYFL